LDRWAPQRSKSKITDRTASLHVDDLGVNAP
jgi:hypothetical protein